MTKCIIYNLNFKKIEGFIYEFTKARIDLNHKVLIATLYIIDTTLNNLI